MDYLVTDYSPTLLILCQSAWLQMEPDRKGAAPAPKFKWRRNAPRNLLRAPNKLMERAAPPVFLSSPHLFSFSGTSGHPPAETFPPTPPPTPSVPPISSSSLLLLCFYAPLCTATSSSSSSVLIPLHMFEYQLEEKGESGGGREGGGKQHLWVMTVGLMQNPLSSWHHVGSCYWEVAMFLPCFTVTAPNCEIRLN